LILALAASGSAGAKLHSPSYDDHALLYAFDLLELNCQDYRREPLKTRKATLAKLLATASPRHPAE
jgi:ATP-dependent DNA ligase